MLVARQTSWSVPLRVPAYRQQGPVDAPVVITEFSDFQCGNCAQVRVAVRELLGRYPGKVRLVFRHMPLSVHKWSLPAARAAESAGLQGRFWEYHDVLFDRQKDWAAAQDPLPLFRAYAVGLGLDAARFDESFADPRWSGALREDRVRAFADGINATPTFFIGGHRLVGEAQFRAYADRYVAEALGP